MLLAVVGARLVHGDVTRVEGDLAETKQARQRLEVALANRTQARPAFALAEDVKSIPPEAASTPESEPPKAASRATPPPLPAAEPKSESKNESKSESKSESNGEPKKDGGRDSQRPTIAAMPSEPEAPAAVMDENSR